MINFLIPINIRSSRLFVSLGVFIRLITTIATIPVLVRFFGIEQFGTWAVLNAQISLFYLAELGITTALVYHLSTSIAEQKPDEAYKYIGSALALLTTLGGMGVVIFIFLVPRFTYSIQGYPMLDKALIISSLVILFWIWGQFCSSIEATFFRFDVQAIIETAGVLIFQIGVVIFAWLRINLSIIVIWILFSSMISLTFHWFALKHILHLKFEAFSVSAMSCRQLMAFGYTHWVAALGSSLFGQADKIIINILLGPTITGIYAATTSIVVRINELSAAPLRVLPSVISKAKFLTEKSSIASLFLEASRINGFVIMLVALPLFFWPDLVASYIVEKPQVGTVVEILPVLTFIYSLYSLGATGFFTMIGLGRPIINAIWGLIGGVAECFFMILLIPKFGLLGGVLANAAYIVVVIINLLSVRVLELNWQTYLKTVAPACLIVLFGFLFSFLPLFIKQNLVIRMFLFLLCVTLSAILEIGPRLFGKRFNTLKSYTTIEG